MNLSDIPEIKVQAVRDEVIYSLPPRPIGKARWLGLFLIGFSLLFISMPVKELIQFLSKILSGSGDIGSWAFSLFLIPFVIVGLFPFRLGVLCIWGRCRVEWRKNRLSVLEYAGPVRWRRRMPKGAVQELTVGRDLTDDSGRGQDVPSPLRMNSLDAVFADGSRKILLRGYPREWVQAIGQDLAVRIGATVGHQVKEIKMTVIDPESIKRPTVVNTEPVQQPAQSEIRVERTPQRLGLLVPPLGIWRGSKGLFAFGILWCLFMTVFTGVAFTGNFNGQGKAPWPVWLFVAGFDLIGVFLVAGAINMGRRRALLVVADGELKIALTGPFGSKRWQWRREELSQVRMGNSGMTVNDVPVKELQIHPHGKKKVGLLSNRTNDELAWLAYELSRALNLTHTQEIDEQTDDSQSVIAQPGGSAIKPEQSAGRSAWIIPPAGIFKGSKGLFIFGIIWCLFMTVFTGATLWINTSGKDKVPMVFWLFIPAFWLVGIGLLAGAINMGRRQAMIVVEGSELKIAMIGPFGAKRWQWPVSQITDVRMGNSGMAVNDVPVKELQIIPRDGKKVGLFSGREEDELRWMAQQMRRAIRSAITNG